MSNHDCKRIATRWGGANPPAGLLRMTPALQLSLRGASCIYQGDELGLPEAEVKFEDLQDPYGITMWPEFKGRDGCRTPMPWDSTQPDLGFGAPGSKHKPWLPVAESHRALAVDRQVADTGRREEIRALLAKITSWGGCRVIVARSQSSGGST